ncbi:MAG: hypothetical protein J6569_04880 [Gilliamella sp.]|uniref:hypothetical protein n=1 Tax=unclassified Gilliamella TaxID=2685620 RepID=UPI0025F46B20|nr:hypothetical protein [Gilliamella sp.]MCO6538037.1 hypothetical protein [Gilliamella sp.]MCO6539454.1 hypothetical protein [Gilliamella sp.]MCO6556782.1 hypothetical protein [Gilliamella sp.]MCO6560340.1 hypothetical protein [Gilliamella sp.]
MTEDLTMHKKISLTNLYFNRFLVIRYTTAFFLFLNLYWATFLIGSLSIVAILPLTLFVLGILTTWEQIKLYRNHCNKLPYARLFYRALAIVFVTLMMMLYTPLYQLFCPFLKQTQDVLNVLAVLLMVSLIITFLMLKKINNIQHNRDQHFKRIQAYEKFIN